jgi:hypothetical protein
MYLKLKAFYSVKVVGNNEMRLNNQYPILASTMKDRADDKKSQQLKLFRTKNDFCSE